MNWKLPLWAVLATGAAGVGGYYAYKGRDCISGQAAVCEKERADLKARSGQIEATLNQMQGNLSTSRQELEALRKWKGDAAKRMQTFRDMSTKLQKMVDAGKLGVRVRDGRLVMRLPQDVLFPSGVADLSRDGELALMEVAVILKQFPDRRFMVAGHTDNQPVKETYKDNWELSMARALVVTRFLVEAKMKPQNIVAAGYGEHDPIAKNATPEGRRENRRIEIILLPDLSELPTLPEDMARRRASPSPSAPPPEVGIRAPSRRAARAMIRTSMCDDGTVMLGCAAEESFGGKVATPTLGSTRKTVGPMLGRVLTERGRRSRRAWPSNARWLVAPQWEPHRSPSTSFEVGAVG